MAAASTFISPVSTPPACGMTWTGVDALLHAVTGSGRWPLVIGYHRVVSDLARASINSIPSMLISERTLERHLDWIGRRFRFVSVDDLGTSLERDGNAGG